MAGPSEIIADEQVRLKRGERLNAFSSRLNDLQATPRLLHPQSAPPIAVRRSAYEMFFRSRH